MSRATPGLLSPLTLARLALTASVAMLLLSLIGPRVVAASATGTSETPPTLQPDVVAAPTDAFGLVPASGARCEEDGQGKIGADGWRWSTFIVEDGRDPATLEFGAFGPGKDYDAMDGKITAPLIAAGRGVWAQTPAAKPEGLINPGQLGGFVLDPSDYKLRDGKYLIGFACTDEASKTRQWWGLAVTVQTTKAPFLTATDAADTASGAAPSTATRAAGSAAPAGTTSTTGTLAIADTSPADGASEDSPSEDTAAGAGATPEVAIALGSTGVSWSPLVALVDTSSILPAGAWALLVLVFARICYLLARPLRIVPPLAP